MNLPAAHALIWLEDAMNNEKPRDDQEGSSASNSGGLRGIDKQQGDLQNPGDEPLETPEGLKRERRGPLDKNLGRGGAT
jgi:hypothetical protein